METLQAIQTRKSVRDFKDTPIEEEKIELLMKAAMSAPSAMNSQPWEFVVVESESKKEAVRKAMPFGKYKSAIIIIPCVREISTIPVQHDLAYCDLGAASENILLAAHDLDLGGVWCAVYPNKLLMKAVKKAADIPAGLTPFSALYIGYIGDNNKGKIKDKYDPKRVRRV